LSGQCRSPDADLHNTAPSVHPAGHQLQWYVCLPQPRVDNKGRRKVGPSEENRQKFILTVCERLRNMDKQCLFDAFMKFIQNTDSEFLKFKRHDCPTKE
jgi:hypothetical protein